MKKLSIFGLALVVALFTGSAFAVPNLSMTVSNPNPLVGETTTVEVFAQAMPGTDFQGVMLYVEFDSGDLQVNSSVVWDVTQGGCLDSSWSAVSQQENCINFQGSKPLTGTCPISGDFKVGEIVFQALTVNQVTLTASVGLGACTYSGWSSPTDDGFLQDDSGVYFATVDDGTATVNAPPACTLNISPGDTAIFDNATIDYDGITANCTGESLSFTIAGCSQTINATTGLFDPDTVLAPETCTVCVTDAVNDSCGEAGSDCCSDVTVNPVPSCDLEIYIGGFPVPPLNTYNKPGRRGLAVTCGDTIQFDACTDCDVVAPVHVWSIDPDDVPTGTSIDPGSGLLTIGDCEDIAYPVEIEVTVTDTANFVTSDPVIIVIGEVVLAIGDLDTAPSGQVTLTLTMENEDHAVQGVQTEITDGADLICTSCTPDADRAMDFTCTANENASDNCEILLVSLVGEISQGNGAIATIDYDVVDAPSNACILVGPTDSKVADRFGDPLCACEVEGEICFLVCADIYPRECLPDIPECGDGVVNIFDVLEEIDIALGIILASPCQAPRADVPTGTPPYCSNADGDIDIFDVLVFIDMALGKANCCDYMNTGAIY